MAGLVISQYFELSAFKIIDGWAWLVDHLRVIRRQTHTHISLADADTRLHNVSDIITNESFQDSIALSFNDCWPNRCPVKTLRCGSRTSEARRHTKCAWMWMSLSLWTIISDYFGYCLIIGLVNIFTLIGYILQRLYYGFLFSYSRSTLRRQLYYNKIRWGQLSKKEQAFGSTASVILDKAYWYT